MPYCSERISMIAYMITLALLSKAAAVCDPGVYTRNGTLYTLWGPLSDLSWLGGCLEGNIFPATLNDTFPTNQLLRGSLGNELYQLRECAPEDVHKCIYSGNSSMGLPTSLLGAFWLRWEGYGYLGEVLQTAGTKWNPIDRRATVNSFGERLWGYESTSSVKQGCWFPFSGASHANFHSTLAATLEIFMNEDYTQGQMFVGITVPFTLGLQILIPSVIIDWTIQLLPENRWLRRSKTFGIDTPTGDYKWHQIVSGDAKPGRWYEDFVNERGGKPFMYLERIRP